MTIKNAIIREIEQQLAHLDTMLEKEIEISKYVHLLSQKRQLEQLLNQERLSKNETTNERDTFDLYNHNFHKE